MEHTIISAIKEISTIFTQWERQETRGRIKFGWSYFNKHRGWNWLLTKTER